MKITNEEQETLYQLRIMAIDAQHESYLGHFREKAAKTEYENALLKVYLKYGLSPTDKINEATGIIEIEEQKEKEEDEQESSS